MTTLVIGTKVEGFDNDTHFENKYASINAGLYDTIYVHQNHTLYNALTFDEFQKWKYAYNFGAYTVYKRIHEENQYLRLITEVLQLAGTRTTRNGDTLSTFGKRMVFNCRNGTLPCITTKRVFLRGVIEELMFFIRGDTQTKKLEEKGIKIWKGNTCPEFQEKCNLGHLPEGDFGKMYGYQWRKWGGDQLLKCINMLKNDPFSRRIVMSAWNAGELNEGVLNPCHIMVQFYCNNEGEVSCQMYQRSADIGLGMPFNITSYALLLHIVSHFVGKKAGDLYYIVGDAHIYVEHSKALFAQIEREPKPFPTVSLNIPDGDNEELLNTADASWVKIHNYEHHGKIAMPMKP